MSHVLIIDDDRETAKMLATACSIFGYTSIKVHSGMDALEIITTHRPDVVLLDLMMPEMDGFETLKHLRAMPEGDDLPVIVVTALQSVNLETRVETAGGDACLRKPVDMDVLARMLSEFCLED